MPSAYIRRGTKADPPLLSNFVHKLTRNLAVSRFLLFVVQFWYVGHTSLACSEIGKPYGVQPPERQRFSMLTFLCLLSSQRILLDAKVLIRERLETW